MSRRELLAMPAAGLKPRVIGLTLALLLCGFCRSHVDAQVAQPAAIERDRTWTPEERQELYDTLRRHAKVLEAQSAIVKTVAKLIGPTVVHIKADPVSSGTRRSSRRDAEEAGAGVIIQYKDKHYVLTNRHVIEHSSAEKTRIYLSDGRQIQPDAVWEDANTDIGVMRIKAPRLIAAPLGDSDRMEIGDFVLAVGSPFDLRQSVTFGIISAKGRRHLELGDASVREQDFIQTDAAINPGNSGGPLVNLQGEVIGINTAIASNSGGSEGIGFAIPINMFMFYGRQLIERGDVTRAYLGVNPDSVGPEIAGKVGLPYPTGALIRAIIPGTPADAADLQVGDVILEFNRVRVEDDLHLINLVSQTNVGTKVPLVIFRKGKPVTVEVRVVDRSRHEPNP